MTRVTRALLAGLVLLLPSVVRTADDPPPPASPLAGSWKVVLPAPRGGMQALWIVKFEEKDGKWTGALVATASTAPKATLQGLAVTKDKLAFELKLPDNLLRYEGKAPAAKAAKLYGQVAIRSDVVPVELEATALTSLDDFAVRKEALAKATGVEAVQAALALLQQAADKKAKPTEVRAWAEKGVRAAELYGPRFGRDVMLNVVEVLTEQKGYEKLALQYAQRAERGLGPKEPPAQQKKVLDQLATALEKAGMAKEAAEVLARVKKLDFRVKPVAYAGRKAKSDRVVLVELFTGAHAPGTVASDLAVEALGKTFKPSEALVLSYHIHSPQPDALANADGAKRLELYEESVRTLPTLLFNGKAGVSGGGPLADAQEKYDEVVDAVKPLLEAPPKAELKLTVTRKGGKVEAQAEVGKLAETGDEVRLRFALVEEQVAYKGKSGQETHLHVVRAFPGGVEGTALKEKTAKKTVTADLDDVRKKLKAYLDKYGEKRPFPSKDQPLELKKLKVVAFVQNDDTNEVYQAAVADVPEK